MCISSFRVCDCVCQAILLGLGLQHRTVESLSDELNKLAIGQILGIFNQLIRQIQMVSLCHFPVQSRGDQATIILLYYKSCFSFNCCKTENHVFFVYKPLCFPTIVFWYSNINTFAYCSFFSSSEVVRMVLHSKLDMSPTKV